MMNKLTFLVAILNLICLTLVFQAQADTINKIKTQQQLDQFQNQLQSRAQETNIKTQQVIQEKQLETAQYQKKQEETSDVFEKFTKNNQQSALKHVLRIYGKPFLIVAAAGIILLIVWHQSI